MNTAKNTWWDESICEGGSLVDLVMKMYCTNVLGALDVLRTPENCKSSFSFSDKQKESSSEFKIISIKPIWQYPLKNYVRERGIDLGMKYLEEAYYKTYSNQEKPFFAVAFRNDKGGYELRSKHFKGSLSPKYIRTIPGRENSLNIFEGFFDYLSALTYFRTIDLKNKTIVLNSTSNIPYVEEAVKNAIDVFCFLDNDESGIKAFEKIRKWNANAVNQSAILYPGYNDFNDFICKKRKT
ncbi:toprim domain-containing protein [Draconibacterium sp.]|uniref:toprim domain-containing protein n=1 Tax=Draconibacterium sp. TaxID=1965318 RepID=UPI0035619F45